MWKKQSADELRIIASVFSNRLSQLSFDAMIMMYNGDGKKLKKLRLVKWAALEYHPDQYRLQVDSMTLPRGRGITEASMSKPEVIQALSMSIQKPVSARAVDGVGLFYLIDREHGVGNVPRFCDYASVLKQARNISPTRIPIGFGGGRKVIYLDFSAETQAHLIVGGTTGGGKSSLLHLVICWLIQQPSDRIKIALFDFKRVEFGPYYHSVPHLLHPIITNPDEFLRHILAIRKEVEDRYLVMERAGVEHIRDYNARTQKPYPEVFVVVDELASIFLNPMIRKGDRDTIDATLGFIAMQARACGIHLILSTQRPDANVLTGYIRACTPCKIAFACSSVNESMIIIGTGHAAFKETVPNGRAIMVRSRFELPFQTAWISKQLRRDIAASVGSETPATLPDSAVPVIAPKFAGMTATIEELATYSLDNLDGAFNQTALFGLPGTSKGGLWEMVKFYSSHPFEIDGKLYILNKPSNSRKAQYRVMDFIPRSPIPDDFAAELDMAGIGDYEDNGHAVLY